MWPEGHSSAEKIIGQFSMAILTPLSIAWPTRSGKTRCAAFQLSRCDLVWSAPTKVLTTGTPRRPAAVMTLRRWPTTAARWSGSGCSGLG